MCLAHLDIQEPGYPNAYRSLARGACTRRHAIPESASNKPLARGLSSVIFEVPATVRAQQRLLYISDLSY